MFGTAAPNVSSFYIQLTQKLLDLLVKEHKNMSQFIIESELEKPENKSFSKQFMKINNYISVIDNSYDFEVKFSVIL